MLNHFHGCRLAAIIVVVGHAIPVTFFTLIVAKVLWPVPIFTIVPIPEQVHFHLGSLRLASQRLEFGLEGAAESVARIFAVRVRL